MRMCGICEQAKQDVPLFLQTKNYKEKSNGTK
jgi:hypothetical protein